MADVIRDQLCPYCGYHVNRASNIADRSLHPKPGDMIICLDCGKPSVFMEDASGIRLPTPAELTEIEADPEYREHHRVWEIWNAHGRKRSHLP